MLPLARMPRIRDPKLLAAQMNLDLSIQFLDGNRIKDMGGWSLNTLRLGQLLVEHGYVEGPKIENQIHGTLPWLGSLKDVEARLTTLRADRDAAQRRLDDALLDDAGRAAQAAEIQARNAKPQRKVRGDGSVYLKHRDGRVEEVETS